MVNIKAPYIRKKPIFHHIEGEQCDAISIIDKNMATSMNLKWIILLVINFVAMLFLTIYGKIAVLLIAFLIFLFLIYKTASTYFKLKKKGYINIIYHRVLGKIILPKGVFREKDIAYNFDRIRIDFQNQRVYYKVNDNLHKTIYLFSNAKLSDEFDDNWSFLAWYMDKNRPLPIGVEFDEYRHDDFDRRKAEGFPKALYSSRIETHEATPVQQAERKKIGGW
jgi:hypothetical protein